MNPKAWTFSGVVSISLDQVVRCPVIPYVQILENTYVLFALHHKRTRRSRRNMSHGLTQGFLEVFSLVNICQWRA